MHGIYAHARFDDRDLAARSQWVSKGKNSALNYLEGSNKPYTYYYGRSFLSDLNFENVYMA